MRTAKRERLEAMGRRQMVRSMPDFFALRERRQQAAGLYPSRHRSYAPPWRITRCIAPLGYGSVRRCWLAVP